MAKVQGSKITVIQPMIISNSRILQGTEVYAIDDSRFKIEINSDGFFSQSYVRLSKWVDNSGFEIIVSQPVAVYFKEFKDAHIGRLEDNQAIVNSFKTKAIKSMIKISQQFL